ncbi:hypothetical protein Leryth_005329 [Lithospermum erythrorhizon]|nr:hypothetical protein Leryth_005329 [Lithospermum erythrorhizon]
MGKILTSTDEKMVQNGVKQLDKALKLFKFVWETAGMKGDLEKIGTHDLGSGVCRWFYSGGVAVAKCRSMKISYHTKIHYVELHHVSYSKNDDKSVQSTRVTGIVMGTYSRMKKPFAHCGF